MTEEMIKKRLCKNTRHGRMKVIHDNGFITLACLVCDYREYWMHYPELERDGRKFWIQLEG